jgi:hypothetical protein
VQNKGAAYGDRRRGHWSLKAFETSANASMREQEKEVVAHVGRTFEDMGAMTRDDNR